MPHVALPKPTDVEAGQWYFQRYAAHLPTAGQITLFDRSWYNRAGVEKVMGFAKPEQIDAFLTAAPQFEKPLVDDGILFFKYWLSCDQEQQEKRFAERLDDPLKRWKLSPIDQAARTKYDDYTAAREVMLRATHTELGAMDSGRFQQPEARPPDPHPRPARPPARHQVRRSGG